MARFHRNENVLLLLLLMLLYCCCTCGRSTKVVSKAVYPIHFANVTRAAAGGGGAAAERIHRSLSANSYACFENRGVEDVHIWDDSSSFLSVVTCLVPPLYFAMSATACQALWGSNSIIVQSSGDVELVKISTISGNAKVEGSVPLAVEVEKWVELHGSRQHVERKILQIPSEPFIICARSSDLFGRNVSFDIAVRETFSRDRDKYFCQEEVLFLILAIVLSSSTWVFPYFAALTVGSFVFVNGIHITISLLCFSGLVVCLTPIMFTSKNRKVISLYLSYYFGPLERDEAKAIIKERTTLLHSLFLSSSLMLFGTMLSYIFYHYFGIHRESRNTILKLVITVSISWFSFFLGRSFDKTASRWVWILLAYGFIEKVKSHTNPAKFEALCIVVGFLSCAVSICSKTMIHSSQFVERIISGIIVSRAAIYSLILKKLNRTKQM